MVASNSFTGMAASMSATSGVKALVESLVASSSFTGMAASMSATSGVKALVESLVASNSFTGMAASMSATSGVKALVESITKQNGFLHMMEGLSGSTLIKATTTISATGLRERLANNALASFYGPGDDDEAAVAALTNVVHSPFTKIVDLGLVLEVAAIADAPERVGRILGTENFSWESEVDVGNLSQITEQIKLEGGVDWWAGFVAGVADMWSCRTPLGSGLGLRRSPEQIATLALILCTLMTCIFVPRSEELVDTVRAVVQPVSQAVGEVAGIATVMSVIAVHRDMEALEVAATSPWTSQTVLEGKSLWEEWGKDIVKNAMGGLLTTGVIWGGRTVYRKVKMRRKNIKRDELKR